MKTSTIFASMLAAATTAIAQNAAAVQSAVYQIGNYSTQLNSDVLNYNATLQGLPWALQVQQDAVLIYRQVQAGKAAADSSAAFGEPGSKQISDTLRNITSIVQTALNNTASKASTFSTSGLAPLVRVSLYQLKQATDLFANSTIKKLSPAEASGAPAIKNELDTAFNNAIKAYGGKATSG